MKNNDKNNIGDTVRIRRPPRVFTNVHGRTIWMTDVEPPELELELELEQEPEHAKKHDPYGY